MIRANDQNIGRFDCRREFHETGKDQGRRASGGITVVSGLSARLPPNSENNFHELQPRAGLAYLSRLK